MRTIYRWDTEKNKYALNAERPISYEEMVMILKSLNVSPIKNEE